LDLQRTLRGIFSEFDIKDDERKYYAARFNTIEDSLKYFEKRYTKDYSDVLIYFKELYNQDLEGIDLFKRYSYIENTETGEIYCIEDLYKKKEKKDEA